MKKKFKRYEPKQILLLPPSIDEWLPEDHPAHFIDEVVEKLDLSAIYNDYREKSGQPPYDPVMMVKIHIYAISKRVLSSRKIEKALYEDIGFRMISANQQPDHWTISEFRRRHLQALGDLFIQTVKLADKAGLVKLKHVAVDGTKIKANASKHSAMSYEYMKKEEERLSREVQELMRQMDENDRKEDKLYGNRRGDELPEELSTRQKRLAAIQKAKEELEAEAQEKLKQEQVKREESAKKKGKSYRPRKKEGKPKMKAQRNFTDSDSRIMYSAEKSFIQGYNAQASVDSHAQIIVAADLTNKENDKEQLKPQIEQVIANVGRNPDETSADAGYFSETNCDWLSANEIDGYLPPNRIKHSEWREQQALRGRIPKDATTEERMRRKLKTKHGRARYKLRQTTVEPVFGFIKEQLGLRQFLHRGLDKTRSYWRLVCGVHNILKLYRADIDLKKVCLS